MMTSLVLTVIADDRPGWVVLLSQTLSRHDGSWLESNMSRLAGKFAGILLAEVPVEQVDVLVADLQALEARGLRVLAERTDAVGQDAERVRRLDLDLVGHYRPGIVRAISEALARSSVNVDRLATERTSAPMSGEQLFRATAQLRLPAGVDLEELRAQLEGIASDLMVDLTLVEPAQ